MWEIMKVFRSNMFAALIRDLQDCHDLCDEARRRIADGTLDSGKTKPSKAELKRILNDLSELEKLCEDAGLKMHTH